MTAIARKALSMGFMPIPLYGKVPIVQGWTMITRERVEKMLSDRIYDGRSVGVVCGEVSGVVVIDVDTGHKLSVNCNDGLDAWFRIIEEHGPIDTFTVKTGGGGCHLYFRYEPRVASLICGTQILLDRSGKRLTIDFKTTGGQVVFAGSRHANGSRYVVVNEHPPIDMPEWLLGMVMEGGRCV